MSDAPLYEKLGAFYLGRHVVGGEVTNRTLLYDAKDLVTHAMCVGMTGSGKTGLCVCLLEEAAIDGIPSIVLDLKGDLTNLLLTFPRLEPGDFLPWVEAGEQEAVAVAQRWREGLASWDQSPARIERFRQAVDLRLYTPGGSFGRPLSILRSLSAPAPAIRDDADALRERIMATVSGLLTLLGLDADPVKSRDHILLSSLLDHAWRGGRSLSLPDLIRQVQTPPFSQVGVFDLDAFYPGADRLSLAMTINNLLASPAFGAWTEGDPLNVPRLLWTPEGQPRLSILYLAHLSDEERMFFMTLLLNEVVAWMRTQSGTGSLRALLYIDEVFGYLPPVANPPSKQALLTLLKQARAFGVGLVLSTQNPVDLDYKALSNMGTWFLGRLQTERDKARVLDGLEGAVQTSGHAFDRREVEQTLSGLGKRVFYLHNVHETEPALFHTRWALSYLPGPLTRAQVKLLIGSTAEEDSAGPGAVPTPPAAAATPSLMGSGGGSRPMVPADIQELFLPVERRVPPGAQLRYLPYLLGVAHVHYTKAQVVDHWETVQLLAPLAEEAVHWSDGKPVPEVPLDDEPVVDAVYGPLGGVQPRAQAAWAREFKNYLYREQRLTLLRAPALKIASTPGESEADFRIRLRHTLHEQRDAEIAALRARYDKEIDRVARQIDTAEDKLAREEGQARDQTVQTLLNVGSGLLGAFLGGKRTSAGGLRSMGRGVGRAARERGDVARASARLEELRDQLAELETDLQAELAELRSRMTSDEVVLEPVEVAPRKSDLTVQRVSLAWVPYIHDADTPPHPATLSLPD